MKTLIIIAIAAPWILAAVLLVWAIVNDRED